MIISNFSLGWQNKARHELMKDNALFMCRDMSLIELGSLSCRRLNLENSYFATQTYTSPIDNVFQVDVEGVNKRLIFYTVGTTLYCWNSASGQTRTISTAITGGHVSYAPLKPLLDTHTYVFITDGVSLLADNGSTTKTWGLDAPENTTLVAMAGAGGNLSAGAYVYKYTFYDGDTGSESSPSPASASTTAAANDLATVSQILTSSDSRITKRRLYRTLVGGGTCYLVAPINDNVTTTYEDGLADADLTTELETDNSIPPSGDVVVVYKDRLFIAGDSNYPNRTSYTRAELPDSCPVTYYLDVGTSDNKVMNAVEFEGKLYFVHEAMITGLYGSDPDTYAWHQTRSHLGTVARWSVAVGPDGIYFVGHDGVYRFDGLKSVRVSDPIGRAFDLTSGTWHEIVDQDTVAIVSRACFLQGVYYVLLPMYNVDGSTNNRVLAYDTFNQTWMQYDLNVSFIMADEGRGKLYGCMEKPDAAGYYSVYELLSVDGSTVDIPVPQALTKSFPIVGPREEGNAPAVGWLRKFRVDAQGDWTLKFYVDGTLKHTEVLSGLDESDRYKWYDFPAQVKGRFIYVHVQATGTPAPMTHTFWEVEVV